MLVLTRRAGQALSIGNDVVVQVVRVEGDRVVLGVRAPKDVRIVRAELLEAVGSEVGVAASGRAAVLEIIGMRGPDRSRRDS